MANRHNRQQKRKEIQAAQAPVKRLHFEDQGQDFLWWDINQSDEVVDCGPFQASIWVGSQIIADSESGIVEGDRPLFIGKQGGDARRLLYAIESIEEKEVQYAS